MSLETATGLGLVTIDENGNPAPVDTFGQHVEIDLIVAGSRGLSRFQGWLMGSVSRKLARYSNCSVLIVKQPA